jgi:hypothetical protein
MRFSEAMLLGLPEIEFTNNHYFSETPDGGCRGCLIGAALFAEGLRSRDCEPHIEVVIAKYWPRLQKMRIDEKCPLCDIDMSVGFTSDISAVCTHMAAHYQHGHLTPSQIADFIHTFEPEEDAPVIGSGGESKVSQAVNLNTNKENDAVYSTGGSCVK